MLGTRLIAIWLMAATAGAAHARPALMDIPELNAGLFTAAMVREIDKQCGGLGVKKLSGFLFLQNLNSIARDAGYSQAEIDAFLDNEDNKAAMRARGQRHLTEQGYDPAQASELCRFGEDQIAAETQIGRYLRKR